MESSKTRIAMAALTMVLAVSYPRLAAADWQSHVKKTWEHKLQQGTTKIALLVDPSPPGISSLEILYEDGAHPSLAEEVTFLRDVIQQLSALGVDPKSLRAISMRGFAEPEVAQKVAIAALHSKMWNSRTNVVGGAERVVGDLLNSLGAYDAFNSAVEEYGLTIRLEGIEKVATAKCLDLNLPDPVCNARHNVKVPVGARLRLAVVRKEEQRKNTSGALPASIGALKLRLIEVQFVITEGQLAQMMLTHRRRTSLKDSTGALRIPTPTCRGSLTMPRDTTVDSASC